MGNCLNAVPQGISLTYFNEAWRPMKHTLPVRTCVGQNRPNRPFRTTLVIARKKPKIFATKKDGHMKNVALASIAIVRHFIYKGPLERSGDIKICTEVCFKSSKKVTPNSFAKASEYI